MTVGKKLRDDKIWRCEKMLMQIAVRDLKGVKKIAIILTPLARIEPSLPKKQKN